jgi:hypothetical protein
MKGTSFGMMLYCIGRRVRACTRLTEAAKALATRDHVRGISGPSALSNNHDGIYDINVPVKTPPWSIDSNTPGAQDGRTSKESQHRSAQHEDTP